MKPRNLGWRPEEELGAWEVSKAEASGRGEERAPGTIPSGEVKVRIYLRAWAPTSLANGGRRGCRAAEALSPDPFQPSYPQGSKKSLTAETQNISNSFEDLDAQVNSETGYTPEDAMGLEETAQAGRTRRAMAVRPHLSTQKMYELKTKLRCSCEGCPHVGQAMGWGQGVGISDSPCPPSPRRGEQGHTQLPPLV